MLQTHCIMRFFFIPVIAVIFLSSCSNRIEYKEEDYKRKQVEYEKKKAELNRLKGKLYEENKSSLMGLAEIIINISDTTKSFKDVPNDTSYFKKDVIIESINFKRGINYSSPKNSNTPKANAVFIHRTIYPLSKEIFTDPLEELKVCYQSKNDFPCLNMESKELKEILDLKYAFILDDLIKAEPKKKLSSDEFESGFYIGNIICYDIQSKKPLLSFVVGAQNSEQISYMNISSVQSTLQRDFKTNIEKEIMQACRKHFYIE